MSESKSKTPASGNYDWDLIAGAIREQKCILFVGPGIFASEKYPRLIDRIAEYLTKDSGGLIKKFYKSDGLFAFSDPTAKTKASFALKKFFQEEDFSEARELLQKIAEIPFSMIFSLTPDDLLLQAFSQIKVVPQHDLYLKNQPPRQADKTISPTVNSPLVYNMFGYIQNRDSLVLTHDDLFDYFNSILAESSMHSDVKEMIKKMEVYIFLGVSFDKWYMRLLLKMLYRLQGRDEFLRFANETLLEEDIRTLFSDQYRIEFVPRQVSDFINQLHKHFEEKGLLRKESEEKPGIAQQLKAQVGEGQVGEAVSGLQSYLDSHLSENPNLPESSIEMISGLSSEILQLRSMLRRLENRKRQGIISEDKADLEMNQITHSLIGYLDEVEAMKI
jgi:hypothetical protein